MNEVVVVVVVGGGGGGGGGGRVFWMEFNAPHVVSVFFGGRRKIINQ